MLDSSAVMPVPSSKNGAERIRLGWFSTWNSRCGFAEYSRYLLNEFDPERFEWTVLASHHDKLVQRDEQWVIRCWTDLNGSVAELLGVLLRERFDAIVIQFKIQVGFGFLSLQQLEALTACCHAIGTRVFMILHATDGADPAGTTVQFRRIADALSTVERVLVHSQADVQRLRAFGVDRNVELFPHGNLDIGLSDQTEIRQQYGLSSGDFVIGAHGFFLPHKGIDKLIAAHALLRLAGQPAKLLLVNALYPIAVSEQHFLECRSIAAELGVEADVIFETGFLPSETSLRLLSACDVIVFPYQASIDSASGAVRLGIASRRPVLCSPLPIFSDVAEVVRFLRGFQPEDIRDDLQELRRNGVAHDRRVQRQGEWVERRAWPRVAQMLQELLVQASSACSRQRRGAWLGDYIARSWAEQESKASLDQAASSLAKAAAAQHLNNTASELDPVIRDSGLADRAADVDGTAPAEIAWARTELNSAVPLSPALQQRVTELEAACREWQSAAETASNRLREVHDSRSWRITGPLRRASRFMRACAAQTQAKAVPLVGAPLMGLPGPGNDSVQRMADIRATIHHWKSTAEKAGLQLAQIHGSRSWRVTKPLRALGTVVRRTGVSSPPPMEGWRKDELNSLRDATELQAVCLDWQRAAERALLEVERARASRSWRVTRPLRAFGSVARSLQRTVTTAIDTAVPAAYPAPNLAIQASPDPPAVPATISSPTLVNDLCAPDPRQELSERELTIYFDLQRAFEARDGISLLKTADVCAADTDHTPHRPIPKGRSSTVIR
jgi:glycosyltransferase involved in cell wall biosynthesis